MEKRNIATTVRSEGPSFFYGYVIVFAAFCIMVISAGSLYSFGVFLKPMAAEFGWSRAMTSGVYSISLFLLGLFMVVTGKLNDKFGPKLIVTVCGILLGTGFLLSSQVNDIWQLYLTYGVIVSMGFSCSLVPMTSTVARWFIQKRGVMTGLVVSGVSVGQMLIPPIATYFIFVYGWRISLAIIGITALVVMTLIAQLLKRSPDTIEHLADYENQLKKEKSIVRRKEYLLKEAIRTCRFWMICTIYFCYGFFVHAIMVHIVPHATDLGISPMRAANILVLSGLLGIVGRIGIGSTGDRIGNIQALIIVFILMAASLFWLQFCKHIWMFYLFGGLFGFSYGGIIALESPVVADLFGLIEHGIILGFVHFSATIGGAISPTLSGLIFDISTNYRIAFFVCFAFSVLGVTTVSFLSISVKSKN